MPDPHADPQETLLAQRAAAFHDQILDVATGPGGMIVAFTSFDTRKPLQEGAPLHWYLANVLDGVWGGNSPKPTVAEWYYGENTLWATGTLLWSQMLRYRATGDAAALVTARKCFHDLNHYFRLSHALEPGVLGKPHGGRGGVTMSYDQSANPILHYVTFAQEFATAEERALATENMALHGDYYLRRNWVMNHHGNLQRIVDPSHTSTMKYLACVHAAYTLTGETRFRDAAFRYLRQILQSGKLPWPTNPYEINHNLFYWAILCDYWLGSEMGSEADWVAFIGDYWRAARTAIDAEGLLRRGPYATDTHTFTPYATEWITPENLPASSTLDNGERRIQRRFVSATAYPNRALNSASFAALALLAHRHGLDDEAVPLAKRTLLRIDDEAMRYWWDDGTLPPDLQELGNIFAPEIPAMWLVAYWTGRVQGAWA
jgi:hypothetical protein